MLIFAASAVAFFWLLVYAVYWVACRLFQHAPWRRELIVRPVRAPFISCWF